MSYPKYAKRRTPIDALTGIKSSLSNLRQVISLTYLLFVVNGRKSFIDYCISIDSKTLTIKKDLLSAISNYLSPNSIDESVINENPLVKNQYEPLYVGMTLLFRLGNLKMKGKQNTAERTGGLRFPKQIYFASNMFVLDLILSGFSEEDLKKSLCEWLNNQKASNKDFEYKVCAFLSVCTAFTQFKVRNNDGEEIFFQTEGIFQSISEGGNDVTIDDGKENVGPTRIYKNVIREELEPWIKQSSHGLYFAESDNITAQEFSQILSTTLDICNVKDDSIIKADIPQEEPSTTHSLLPLQQIFYGAPGTGKSFSIKSVIAEHMSIDVDQVDMEADNIFRTTFHPDYDYAQFVGCYKPTKEKNGDITYDFVPQVFVNALVEAYGGVQLAKSSSNTSATTGQVANSESKEDDLNEEETVVEQTVESEVETQAVKPVYLVIEEINRGNCAQIFGDIFQLLDRNANGESEYSISVDKDLREYLEINCPNAICNGKIKLPANLSIIATMNTSDQSLFPMDSAFKRRWEWEYVPIKNQNFDKDGNLIHFRIVVEEGRYEYDWNVFQNAVNVEIKEKTNSEDKQMGDYFIKKDVTLDEFINKVMFYLWNDICKENYHTEDNFFRTEDESTKEETEFSFGEMMADKVNKINGFMRKLKVKNLIETSESTDASDVSTPESSAD